MQISELSNYNVKVGKSSITAKDDNNKTRGVVRNIWKFMDLQANKQINYFRKLRDLKIWGSSRINMDDVVYDDGRIYILRDMRFPEKAADVYEAIKADGVFTVIEVRRILR